MVRSQAKLLLRLVCCFFLSSAGIFALYLCVGMLGDAVRLRRGEHKQAVVTSASAPAWFGSGYVSFAYEKEGKQFVGSQTLIDIPFAPVYRRGEVISVHVDPTDPNRAGFFTWPFYLAWAGAGVLGLCLLGVSLQCLSARRFETLLRHG